MNDADARAMALQIASGAGLPHELTLKSARAYYAFLQGKEPVFDVADAWRAVAVTALKGRPPTKAATKKPKVTFSRRPKAA